MELLKATEANRIAIENDETAIVKEILENVKIKAEAGEFELKVMNYGFADPSLYIGTMKPKQLRVVKLLESLGYKARLEVLEKQFVEIFLNVQWGDN